MKEMHWNYLGRQEEAGIWCDEYINDEKTHLRQVWHDGYEEIFEIGD
jgi:hypothetical protein